VLFVEHSRDSIRVISENVKMLKVEAATTIKNQDVFKFIKSYKGDPLSLILCDPPYTEMLAHSVLQALVESSVAAPGAKLMIESSKQERIDELYEVQGKGRFRLLDRREFGDKSAAFFEYSDLR
jgi:16S rRNA (guanine966-N2)-methyltransferase